MRLDDAVAAQPGKQTVFMVVAFVSATVLSAWVPVLDHWRAGTFVAFVTAAGWAARRPRCVTASLAYDGLLLAGALFYDYLTHQASPVISPSVFAVASLPIVLPLAFWLAWSDRRRIGRRDRNTPA